MFACVMKEFSKGMPVFSRYEGYRLLAVDGTVVTSVPVEDSPNYVPGGRPTKNGTLPKGTCQRTMTALYDVLNKQYLDVVPDKSENAAAKELFSGLNLLSSRSKHQHRSISQRFVCQLHR